MLNYKLTLANVGYNPDFLFAADLERKNLWRNIFRMFKYYFMEPALVPQLKGTPKRELFQMGHPEMAYFMCI